MGVTSKRDRKQSIPQHLAKRAPYDVSEKDYTSCS